MGTDVIEKIVFSDQEHGKGEIRFSYLQDVENVGAEFTEPRVKRYTRQRREDAGIFWLFELISSTNSTSLGTH